MIESAVILAGGFGTRLASVVSDLPKPMAPVANRPFLEHLLDRLQDQGLKQVVLAVGYRREAIIGHFGDRYRGLSLSYIEEREPLGTGGALRQAFQQSQLDRALALNGDSYCDLDLSDLVTTHRRLGLCATLSLVHQEDAARFGRVEIDAEGRIRAFQEKSETPKPGLINAGIYALEASVFELAPAQQRFSFETDILQAHCARGVFGAHAVEGVRFIDIGVPHDFERAQSLFA